jgi:lysophospholipase L1-like esterase
MKRQFRRGGRSRASRSARGGSRLRRPPGWATLLIVAGLVAVGVLARPALADRKSAAYTAPAAPSSEAAPQQLSVAFLGDSYVAGTGTDSASKSFARVASRTLGWAPVDVFAVGGTGYATPPETNYMSRVSGVISVHPDIVVVSGSRNDMGATTAVAANARSVFTAIKAGLPDARLLVIGPMWTSDDIPQQIRDLNEVLRQAAQESGAVFFDALAPTSWLPGDPGEIAPDGVHPTELGHQIIARAFVDAVRSQQPDLVIVGG